jgi:serine/threonine-protein kinase
VSQPIPVPSPIVPGTLLAGKYRVERVLGQGGMGMVVEARHTTLDERVAIKLLLPEHAARPDASARFLREARVAARIKSEHVARVSDVGTLENGAPYLVMECLDGCDLAALLQRAGVLGVADAVDYVVQGCEALAEAHGYGIVHRDVKPANLFLTRRPNGLPLVKVLDFGISKVAGAEAQRLTRTGAILGSALYMSPEQMQKTKIADHRADVYALGASLYELLAGRPPFVADTLPALWAKVMADAPTPLRQLRPDVPEGLAAVLEKAYARNRDDRWQTVGALVVALAPYAPARSQAVIESIAKLAEPVLAGPPSSVAPPSASTEGRTAEAPARAAPEAPRASTRSRVVAVSVVAAIAASLVVGAFVAMRGRWPGGTATGAPVVPTATAGTMGAPPPALPATSAPSAVSAPQAATSLGVSAGSTAVPAHAASPSPQLTEKPRDRSPAAAKGTADTGAGGVAREQGAGPRQGSPDRVGF